MQGSTSVAFGYDNASRRTSATLPNGITAAYVYDAASELTSITYKTSGGTTLGTLTYTYGPDGWVTSRSGTLFTSVLPAAVMSSTYNAGNQPDRAHDLGRHAVADVGRQRLTKQRRTQRLHLGRAQPDDGDRQPCQLRL